MNQAIRPMTLGEILDRTAELYRTHFLLFAGISTLFAGAMLAIQLFYVRTLTWMNYPNFKGHWTWAMAVLLVAQLLMMLVLAGLGIVANNRAVAWIYLDHPATIRAAVGSIRPRAARYLWLMTQVALRAWSPLAALYVVFFVIVFASLPHGLLSGDPTAMQHPSSQDMSALLTAGIGMLILLPLMLAAVADGVVMSLRYSLAVPACVVEELEAGAALKRSVELSAGSRGRIFVLGLLVGVIRSLLGTIFGFPIILIAFRHPGQPLPLQWMVLQQFGVFLANAFIGPTYGIGLTLFYYDQRIRKEGFDIEWMMRAAGLEASSERVAGVPGQ